MNVKHVLLSRTDSIGDVILTLPMAKALKDLIPGVTVSFLGKSYTKPVIEACKYVDRFVDEADFLRDGASDVDSIIHVLPKPEIAKKAKALGIPARIGTTNRFYHWRTCNKLIRLSRKNSDLHEAQLNLKLLKPVGFAKQPSFGTMASMAGLQPQVPLPDWLSKIENEKPVAVLHPKSQGSAKEWPLERFAALAECLLDAGYSVAVTGTAAERPAMKPLLESFEGNIIDTTGRLSLAELIAFIASADALVAASTGPLHIAGALNKAAVGLYPSMRPMHPGRWAPLGSRSICLEDNSQSGNVLNGIAVQDVFDAVERQLK